MAYKIDKEFFFSEMNSLKEIKATWKRAAMSTGKVRERALSSLLSRIVMSIGWLTLDLVEDSDNGELILAQAFRQTYLELLLQNRGVGIELMDMMAEDSGKIITPEHKGEVVAGWGMVMADAKAIHRLFLGQHILDKKVEEKKPKPWDEL